MADQEPTRAHLSTGEARAGSSTWGVLLVAHGTVNRLEDLPAFVSKIRRGRPAPEGLIEELAERYRHIGGSPLLDITERQARAVSERLGVPAFTAMRLWHPFVEEVLPKASGLEQLCVVPMAPYSVDVYRAAAERSFAEVPGSPKPVFASPWGIEPALVQAHAASIRRALGEQMDHTEIVLTAHSLPMVAIRSGDTYCQEFDASARAVERALGKRCHVAYQSQGADGGEWLGPSIEETLVSLAETGAETVAIAPIGFLAEHIETLYDLDVAAVEQAHCLGLELVRVPALDTDPGLIEAIATVALRAMAGIERPPGLV
jgi:ferrochelatase